MESTKAAAATNSDFTRRSLMETTTKEAAAIGDDPLDVGRLHPHYRRRQYSGLQHVRLALG